MTDSRDEVTQLLGQLGGEHDSTVFERLLPLIHAELRSMANDCLRREGPGHTLQPTALVNEAFLKLAGQQNADWKNRGHFLAIAATAMRRILVDHARAKKSQRRGGDRGREVLDSDLNAYESQDIDLIALDAAMLKLAEIDPQKVRIVEMRFFAGLGVEETAQALDTSPSTIKREWRIARVWLKREIDSE